MHRQAAGDEGVLIATGNENAGCSVFVQNQQLVFDYNAFGDHTIVQSGLEVPSGEVPTPDQASECTIIRSKEYT